MVVLGAASPLLGLKEESFAKAITSIFGSKGSDVVELNNKALKAGRDYAVNHM